MSKKVGTHSGTKDRQGNADLVIERIGRAFSDVRLEDGVSIRESRVIDDYGTLSERKKARARDTWVIWMDVPDDIIERHHVALCFMDDKGLRFHLPAYMRFAIRHFKTSDAKSVMAAVYRLDRLDDPRRFLTFHQRAAIRRFLKFMAHNGGEFVDVVVAKKAWKKWVANS
ncbi:MAG: hypothetical protein KIS92_05155 [Planctomycetota bacterium]|nr:hypothetical protein [Planctomycetota bacterium]